MTIKPTCEVLEQGVKTSEQKTSDLEQANEVLRESKQSYRLLFEQSNDAIFLVEKATGRYLDANRAAEELAGRPLATLKTLTTHDVTPVKAKERIASLS